MPRVKTVPSDSSLVQKKIGKNIQHFENHTPMSNGKYITSLKQAEAIGYSEAASLKKKKRAVKK
jgi:hypothetical protein